MEQYLQSTCYFDAANPQVVAQARALAGDASDPLEIARRLYLGVRDGVRYNPYTFSPSVMIRRVSAAVIVWLRVSHTVFPRRYCSALWRGRWVFLPGWD